ncbi:hypothetical protein D3C71_1080410 [compost metagenome]
MSKIISIMKKQAEVAKVSALSFEQIGFLIEEGFLPKISQSGEATLYFERKENNIICKVEITYSGKFTVYIGGWIGDDLCTLVSDRAKYTSETFYNVYHSCLDMVKLTVQ